MVLTRHNACIPTIRVNVVIILLHFKLRSTCYKALQMKNITRSASAINHITTEIEIKHVPRLFIAGKQTAILLHFQIFYMLQTKNSTSSTSTVNPLTMEISRQLAL